MILFEPVNKNLTITQQTALFGALRWLGSYQNTVATGYLVDKKLSRCYILLEL